tara:strand:- start:384 stop:545 length:162 start_codon:yes stop_codon:yes gene_type:complete
MIKKVNKNNKYVNFINKKYNTKKNIVLPTVPGANFILPILKKVTNFSMILFIN